MKNGTYAHYIYNIPHGQDAILTRSLGLQSVLDVVLDGVTTSNGGFASQFIVSKLRDVSVKNKSDLEDVMKNLNTELFTESTAKLRGETAATTATITIKTGNILYCFNVGNSPGYVFRGDDIIKLTELDTFPGSPTIITAAVGADADYFNYHLKGPTVLELGDKLFLATDGITDNVYPEEIQKIVRAAQTPEIAKENLAELLKQKRVANTGREELFGHFKEDDATALIRFF